MYMYEEDISNNGTVDATVSTSYALCFALSQTSALRTCTYRRPRSSLLSPLARPPRRSLDASLPSNRAVEESQVLAMLVDSVQQKIAHIVIFVDFDLLLLPPVTLYVN